jgi:hypothetical protein
MDGSSTMHELDNTGAPPQQQNHGVNMSWVPAALGAASATHELPDSAVLPLYELPHSAPSLAHELPSSPLPPPEAQAHHSPPPPSTSIPPPVTQPEAEPEAASSETATAIAAPDSSTVYPLGANEPSSGADSQESVVAIQRRLQRIKEERERLSKLQKLSQEEEQLERELGLRLASDNNPQ